MTASESQRASSSQLLSLATRLGHVHLTVADLEGQMAFYQNALGLRLHWRDGATAGLGAGKEDLVRLTEVRGARRVRGTTGLYHLRWSFPVAANWPARSPGCSPCTIATTLPIT